MPSHLLAIDQGTTSTRAFLFDEALRPSASRSWNFRRSFPRPAGSSTTRRASGPRRSRPRAPRWRAPASSAQDVAAIGITNQRETTIIWDRKTGKPIHNAIVWQDRRTHEACAALARAGHEKLVSERTGLLLDPYFSATKIAWLLDNVPDARAAAEAGQLAFGTVDTYLLWHFTGGKVHATDATNAARTALLDIRTGQWDDGAARAVPRAARAAAGGARLARPTSAPRCRICSAGRCASSASRAISRPRPSGRAASSPA